MSNYCQNCYELTEEISKLKAENIHLCEYKDELQAKLEKIEYIVNHCGINDKDCCFCKFDKECEGYYIDFILKIIRGEK